MGDARDRTKPLRYVKPPAGMPATVRVVSQRWRVKYVSNLITDRALYGQCIYASRLLLVDSTQALEVMKATLLHEVLHACIDGRDCDSEERFVGCLEAPLLSFLRDNQRWWK